MITEARKTYLQARGYYIENMTEEYGPGWWDAEPYRYMMKTSDDFGDPQATEEDAWVQADKIEQIKADHAVLTMGFRII